MRTAERIEDLFQQCCSQNGTIDLRSVFRLLWSSLNNSVSLVDLAGVYAVSIPGSSGLEVLTRDLFSDFIRAFARLRFPSGNDFCDRMLDEIGSSRGQKTGVDTSTLASLADKNVVRVLLKYDLPLRKAFSAFSSQGMRSGGMVSWEEVRQLSLGMELDGLLAFCGAYSIVPQLFSSQQCEAMFKEVLSKHSIHANASTLHSNILYPQFQLLLALMSLERTESQLRKQDNEKSSFARKITDSKSKPMVDQLQEFFRDIGVSKFDDSAGLFSRPTRSATEAKPVDLAENAARQDPEKSSNLMVGTVVHPSSQRSQDMYQSAGNHAKQAMILRMEHLFDEIEAKLVTKLPPDAAVLTLMSAPADEIIDSKVRLPTKPVVIGDAVPVPSICPDTVEQLLEAALAHHNLGSYEEALKFLEAARIQLSEIAGQEREGSPGPGKASPAPPFFDVQMYVTLCKGNVYQSCGDDEQSLLQYIEGWAKARQRNDQDWEIICVNCAGMLAFYNLRYDVALLCFNAVVEFRTQAYGVDSADTATAMNNEACALYCLGKRGESRIRFEKAWHVTTASLGHRAPRAITIWKNLEKARRSHAPLQSKKDIKESISMRDDASRLLIGGSFTIAALPPPEAGKKKKKVGGKKKKKK